MSQYRRSPPRHSVRSPVRAVKSPMRLRSPSSLNSYNREYGYNRDYGYNRGYHRDYHNHIDHHHSHRDYFPRYSMLGYPGYLY